MQKSKSGFTLVELMIVIVVIVILATITAVSYVGSQARARDTRRKADLTDIAEAVQLYRQKFGTDASGTDRSTQTGGDHVADPVNPQQCGDNGSNGWFNYANGTNDETILTCLQNNGYLDSNSTFADPSNCITNTIALPGKTCKDGRAYMKYTCNDGTDASVTYIYAKLETENNTSAVAAKTGSTVCSGYARAVTTYGMNYVVVAN